MASMVKRYFWILVILSVLSVLTSQSNAADRVLFGPKELSVTRLHFHISIHGFKADDPGNGLLTITKNTPDKKIRGGLVVFDNRIIQLRSFLRGSEFTLYKEISLSAKNRFMVFLRGTPGASVTLEIREKAPISPPEIDFSAEPQEIKQGDSSTLSWTTANADSVSIDQGIGSVDQSGFRSVSPQETTTYTLTASGAGGTTTESVTVTVRLLPTVTMSADPETITIGDSSTLSWVSFNVDKAYIDNGIGEMPLNGSTIISPEHTTTYTITVTGALGSARCQAIVMVAGNPQPQPEGSFGKQYEDLIPIDATVEEYDPKRFSLITGLVTSLDGSPVEDVSITIHGQPEFGRCFTDGNGCFSIPVEGGSTMTIVYKKKELIPAQRKVYVPWNDIAIAKTIQMIPEDPVSTTITFDGNPETIVAHQSTEVTDEFGSRSCTMIFTGDNGAYLVDEEGNEIHELTTIVTRATEYTTPDSMPAILPPTSAYTYCVELSVDGAQRVRFEKPIIAWVDNFLGFDVGEIVPVGFYDRDRGVWVPSDNGVVVKLLDTDSDGTVDALDADGDDQPDDLNYNGSFVDEVKGLKNAQQYPHASTFWRVAITHFSAWDCNWPFIPPGDAFPPNPEGEPEVDQQKDKENECKKPTNSFVEERSRIFHEEIRIPGTEVKLHYASNRVEGYNVIINVPVSGDTVPESVKRIIAKLKVAGRTFEQVLDPLPNQNIDFIWDGLDYLGKRINWPITAYVSIAFVYDVIYLGAGEWAQAFAQPGDEATEIFTRLEYVSWKCSNLTIFPPKVEGKNSIADGWTVSKHHNLDLVDLSTLYKGDGTKTRNNLSIINTVAGTGQGGYSGDGGPASDAQLNNAHGIAIDAGRNLYIADTGNHRIRKVDTSGIITTVAGNGYYGYSGDGWPAVWAQLFYPNDVDLDAGGNLYIADTNNHRIRKVDTSGIITTVAGNGYYGYSGDGGPAIQAQLNNPTGLAVDSWGNLYIADSNNQRIRKIDTNGFITTVAGRSSQGYSGDGGPAIQAQLNNPTGLAVDSWGNLYIADQDNRVVRKVDTSGIITTVAGNGRYGYSGDGGLATEARLVQPYSVCIDISGNLYIADRYGQRIRKVDTNGIITTFAGNGYAGSVGDGGPASQAMVNWPVGVDVDASGSLYISNYTIRKVAKPSAFISSMTLEEIAFADDNNLVHIMSNAGLHKRTVDLDTGIVLYEFGYDEDKNLISITNRFGNEATINRDGSGVPTSFTSPDGITTNIIIDAHNHLTQITYPDGNFYSFEYTSCGLMTAKIEPEGNRFGHVFDANGRLLDATDQEGGDWHYSRTTFATGDILTEVTTAEGNLTTYLDHIYSTGAYISTITDPTGAETLYSQSADGLTVNKSLPCGMELEFRYDLDPEYKFEVVKEMTESTPTGLEKVTLRDKAYEETDADEIPDLITETVTVNGNTTTLENDVLQSQRTITSPMGRTVTTLYNPDTLLTTRLATPGLYETVYGYDARGRLTSLSTGSRETAFSYNEQGFLSSITDPEDYTTSYTYDAVGRMTGINRPDGSSIGFTYDGNGNMTVLTNPSDIEHSFGYNFVNRNSAYQTPSSGIYSYIYDKDRRLIQTHFPSGKKINNIYDKTRLTQIQTPEGNIDFTYLCGTKVESITNGVDTIAYGYDGSLVSSETLSGTLNETLSYGYNNDFSLTSFTYAGDTHLYTYDDDRLLTGAGGFTIFRSATNGLPESVSGGALNLSRTFNGYGEVEVQDFIIGGQNLTSWNLIRDDNGRITQKTEMVDGVSSDYSYTYDSMGRLKAVSKDGTLVEEYQYGSNGTRTYEMNALRGITGRTFGYSDEDHLLTAGDTTYTYTVDGFLTTKTLGAEITSYEYSSRGELLSVKLPDGIFIEYLHDPLGRRIAKKMNGVIVEKYLWQGLTRLLAVYDGSDNLTMRFEYADARMPVAMTRGGATYYLTYDQVGSLRIVADTSGNVVKILEYDSFGNIINDTNPSFTVPFGFAGGLHDRGTNLVRFGFRDYDPDIGRWTSKDPIGFMSGDIDLYGYCLSDPINSLDSIGLLEISDLVSVGMAIMTTTAKVGGLISVGLAQAIGGVTTIGTILIPSELADEDQILENYRTMQEIKDLNMRIADIQNRLEPILDLLNIEYDWDDDNSCT
jgi:RHS repeat-associated protein